MRRHLLHPLVLIAASSLHAQTFASPEMRADRARRDNAIHWPAAYSPDVAPVFSHNELLLHTTCHNAYTHMADATTWPDWFPLVKDVAFETPAPMREGTLLRLKIFNSPIHTRIVEFVPDQRISWVPYGSDETETSHGHFHTWHFVPQGPADKQACLVITEETGTAAYDRKDPAAASHYMHKAHELWLDGLKYASEP